MLQPSGNPVEKDVQMQDTKAPPVFRTTVTAAELGRVREYLRRVSDTPANWLVDTLLLLSDRNLSDRSWGVQLAEDFSADVLTPSAVADSAGAALTKFCRRIGFLEECMTLKGKFHVSETVLANSGKLAVGRLLELLEPTSTPLEVRADV